MVAIFQRVALVTSWVAEALAPQRQQLFESDSVMQNMIEIRS
jgi:hypothetical protein